DFAKSLNQKAKNKQKKASIHVKIDTGMGRIGVDYSTAYDFIVSIKELDWLEFEGIFTHFATSDEDEKTFTYLQISRFNSVIDELKKNNINPEYIHASNSGGILAFPDAYYNAVRPGITVYGCYPSEDTPKIISLKPALTLKSKITFLRDAKKGTTVSYGCTHRLTRNSKIAVLPVGYADGYSRFLSNKGEVAIRGQKAPVVGRVCMDQIMVDVTDIDGVCIGDEAILYGGGYDYLNVSKIAEKIGTINYEVFCNISKRVPRIYINN
ncbi:MAG: alanine racemase, partial [Armatimonadota bacterium]